MDFMPREWIFSTALRFNVRETKQTVLTSSRSMDRYLKFSDNDTVFHRQVVEAWVFQFQGTGSLEPCNVSMPHAWCLKVSVINCSPVAEYTSSSTAELATATNWTLVFLPGLLAVVGDVTARKRWMDGWGGTASRSTRASRGSHWWAASRPAPGFPFFFGTVALNRAHSDAEELPSWSSDLTPTMVGRTHTHSGIGSVRVCWGLDIEISRVGNKPANGLKTTSNCSVKEH
jgi:hypothetical protein